MKLKRQRPEDATQSVITEGLAAYGYVVYVLSRRAKRCPHCREYSHAGDGVSKGAPDLIVRRPAWPRGVCVSIEVKPPGPVKYSSLEQRVAHEAGDTYLVQSLEAALAAVEAVDRSMGGTS